MFLVLNKEVTEKADVTKPSVKAGPGSFRGSLG
jgi:hypothetical protein